MGLVQKIEYFSPDRRVSRHYKTIHDQLLQLRLRNHIVQNHGVIDLDSFPDREFCLEFKGSGGFFFSIESENVIDSCILAMTGGENMESLALPGDYFDRPRRRLLRTPRVRS